MKLVGKPPSSSFLVRTFAMPIVNGHLGSGAEVLFGRKVQALDDMFADLPIFQVLGDAKQD